MSAREPEPHGVATGRAVIFTACLFALAAIGAGTVWLVYPSARTGAEVELTAFPAPALNTRPVAAFEAYREAQRARLDGAGGWTPIEAAMERIAARGADAFAPLEGE